jgi:hypothetical protein
MPVFTPYPASMLQASYPDMFNPDYLPPVEVKADPDSVTPDQAQEGAYEALSLESNQSSYLLTVNGLTGTETDIQSINAGTLNKFGLGPQTVYTIDPNSINVPSVRVNNTSEPPREMTKIEDITSPLDLSNYEVPNTLHKYPGLPVFFEMIDSSNTPKGIFVNNNFYVATLKLTPNPENMIINSSKKIQRFNTLSGWIEEHWGDEIDTVSFSGSTFALFGLDYGLTSEFRTQTDAYAFLKELVHLYQLNGCIYQNADDYDGINTNPAVAEFLNNNPDFVGNHPRKGMVKERLYLRLSYDYLTLLGRFETFDIIEDSNKPFRFTYNIIFRAERTFYTLDMLPGQSAGNPSETTSLPPNLTNQQPGTTAVIPQ